MFQYNRFWHFWFQLNNRHYFRIFFASFVSSLFVIPAALFITPLWALVIAIPVFASAVSALFTLFSNVFYNRQTQQLTQLRADATDELLVAELDLYINRRVICPAELLNGMRLNLVAESQNIAQTTVQPPLIVETENDLTITKVSHAFDHRNPAVRARNYANQIYIKTVAAQDGLSEIAAREMAELLGFDDLIPSNTIAATAALPAHSDWRLVPNNGLIISREKIKQFIDVRRAESPEVAIKNSTGVQNTVAKFILNLKTAAYRTRVKKNEKFKLLHLQQLMPDVVDGMKLYSLLFNESPLHQFLSPDPKALEKRQQRAQAKDTIQRINLASFQNNFLLQIILGSQDANPGNTLFSEGANNEVMLHSIDHERIMPEDNYNICKKTDIGNDVVMREHDLKNVFPIRLWLAGLPQADVPFSRDVLEQTLARLNLERLLAYHRHKRLFSAAAVGAQYDRIVLIKKLCVEQLALAQIMLTPKQLFLKLVNNHPTYLFIKQELQYSDFSTFMLLGQMPEGADMSLLRHPLQWFPMRVMTIKKQLGYIDYSNATFNSAHSHHLMFFNDAREYIEVEQANQAGLDALSEIIFNPTPTNV